LSTPLFSHRLELENTEVIVTDPEPYPVAYLRVAGGKLVEKEGWVRPGVIDLRDMLGLGVDEGVEGLDEPGRELLGELRQSLKGKVGETSELVEEVSSVSVDQDEEVKFNQTGKWFAASITGVTRENESIGEELARCFDATQGTPTSRQHEVLTKDTNDQQCSHLKTYPSPYTHPTSPSSSHPCHYSYLQTQSTRRTLVPPHHHELLLLSPFLREPVYVWKWLGLMIVHCPALRE